MAVKICRYEFMKFENRRPKWLDENQIDLFRIS